MKITTQFLQSVSNITGSQRKLDAQTIAARLNKTGSPNGNTGAMPVLSEHVTEHTILKQQDRYS